MMIKFFLPLLYVCFFVASAHSQTRIRQSINSNWSFHKGDIKGLPAKQPADVRWQSVSIPHSWNTEDVTDDEPGYYRGISWYKKTLYLPASVKNKQTYLYFEGANQVAEVYVNGQLAGKHVGGYTAFSFLIQPYLKAGNDSLTANEVLVKLDNSYNESIPPLDADFTFFGGIYRDVYLITADNIHFDMDNYASSGIQIKTPLVNANTATISISGKITNRFTSNRNLMIMTEISDAEGKLIKKVQSPVKANASGNTAFMQQQQITMPHLWSPNDPYLYRIVSKIIDRSTGALLDEVSNPLGLRWYSFDAAKGFYLNGKPLKLIGASRHQDFKDMANALPDAIHQRDMELLKNMGANFVRIAHYPQDPAILEACDRLGLLASVEIPIVNYITESDSFYNNCKQMQIEMVRQNFNHPSIIIWAYMNEVLLRPKYEKNSDEQNRYFASITALAKQIEALTHQEDSGRYTMIPCHGDYNLYNRVGLTAVPQIVGWNLYPGWYSPRIEDFAGFLDKYHQEFPQKPMIVTEFGADADTRIHSTQPERFDKSIEYQTYYHQYYLKTILQKPFVAGAAIWNLVDFNSEQRKDATPHINTKGITTSERIPKDAYFFYQANLLKKPFLKIGATGWKLRTGIADLNNTCTQQVYIFTNGVQVQLWHNGKMLQNQATNSGVAVFQVPFTNGNNTIKAASTVNGVVCEDIAQINFKLIPALFKNKPLQYTDLNISLGDRRFFVDEKLAQVWMPEQPYHKGSWGYIGGKVFTMPAQSRQSFGSDKDIYGTDMDAIYQTQRTGIQAFKFDVPDGEYELTLGFAELEGKATSPALVYNLGNAAQTAEAKQRAFDVLINGTTVIPSLSTQNYLVPQTAYTTTFRVSAKNSAGITVNFKPLKGEAILNAIQLKQVF
ncbi:beta-galactosidase [Mucilaginibacter sp. HMF7410]|uniref:Beta-galactosidase n=2 Tax=Mucilaginibacter arboris TaxID=2682090 RepID=A0A7K1SUI8_9SPHI|nr:beta-galactosidase [Mucilaginibacter arboris]